MKRKIARLGLFLLTIAFCLAFCSCGAQGGEKEPSGGIPQEETAEHASAGLAAEPLPPTEAEMMLAGMSLREKVGQLFIVRPEALDTGLALADRDGYAKVYEMNDRMRQTLADYPCGGYAIFSNNIRSASQLTDFLAELREETPYAPFFAIDEEGGSVARLANSRIADIPRYQNMGTVGASGDPEKAHEIGLSIGSYLKEWGFSIDFAPVADVNTNPRNRVIGSRAFGDDPQLVADMVRAAVEGFHEAGVYCCVKHFPGHGDTTADTHTGSVSISKSLEELRACEFLPFAAAIDAGTDLIMAAHISDANVTGDDLPASLSRVFLTDILRGELGYEGLIITDSLAMGAIRGAYGSGRACVLAFDAGADLLLMPYDYPEAFDAVAQAVESGEISEERLDESVLRILNAKLNADLH